MARLMLRDKVSILVGGGRDENDDEIPATQVPIRAEVVPISGDQQAARGRTTALTTYRLVVVDPRIETVTSVLWRGRTYKLEGLAMPYRIGGRTHHYEVLMSFGQG